MISSTLLGLVRCPDCRGPLADTGAGLGCGMCGRLFHGQRDGWLDLRPAASFADTTKYVDDALHADARHETVSPPLLTAGIRQHVLERFLDLGPSDLVVDLGCGSGRVAVWNGPSGAHVVGVDVSPYFAAEACHGTDLVLADLRRLPFADATFDKGYSLDVLEHLPPASLREMLAEAARVLRPGGRLFVYSHVRRNAWIAGGLRATNALARWLERWGVLDMTHERLRKSDHVNPLADIPELEREVARAGLRLVRIRYYTPLVGGFVENILMRAAEHQLARRAARRLATGAAPGDAAGARAVREARGSAKRAIARSRLLAGLLAATTWIMRVDLWLFGRIRSGPFFALLERRVDPAA
jgi:SAM-dependent methyltransferase